MGRIASKFSRRSRAVFLACVAARMAGCVLVLYSALTFRRSDLTALFPAPVGSHDSTISMIVAASGITLALSSVNMVVAIKRSREYLNCCFCFTAIFSMWFFEVARRLFPLASTGNRWIDSAAPTEAEELEMLKTFNTMYCSGSPASWLTHHCPSTSATSQWCAASAAAIATSGFSASNSPYVYCRPELLGFLTRLARFSAIGCVLVMSGALLALAYSIGVDCKEKRRFDRETDDESVDDDAAPYTPTKARAVYSSV